MISFAERTGQCVHDVIALRVTPARLCNCCAATGHVERRIRGGQGAASDTGSGGSRPVENRLVSNSTESRFREVNILSTCGCSYAPMHCAQAIPAKRCEVRRCDCLDPNQHVEHYSCSCAGAGCRPAEAAAVSRGPDARLSAEREAHTGVDPAEEGRVGSAPQHSPHASNHTC